MIFSKFRKRRKAQDAVKAYNRMWAEVARRQKEEKEKEQSYDQPL